MLTRKTFLLQIASAGGLLVLGGCGGSDDGPASAALTACKDTVIASNHGHTLTVPIADLDSTTSKTYNIQGSSGHNHTLTLTAAQLAQLKAGTPVTVVSSVDNNHSHSVTGACT